MPNQLKAIQNAKKLVILAYLHKCQVIYPQIKKFRQNSIGKRFEPNQKTELKKIKATLNSNQLNTFDVHETLDQVTSQLYYSSNKKGEQFLYQIFRIARKACHNKFTKQMSSLGLSGLSKQSAKQTTSLGTFLIDLTTIRNLYQILQFLDSEVQIALRYQRHESEKLRNVNIEHHFMNQVAHEPSLFTLYHNGLSQLLKKSKLTLAQAQSLPNFIKFQYNISVAMQLCKYITGEKHNQKLFNLSAKECLHLPKKKN